MSLTATATATATAIAFVLTVWEGPNAPHPFTVYPQAITDGATCIAMMEHYNETDPTWSRGAPTCEIELTDEPYAGPDFIPFNVGGKVHSVGPCYYEDSTNCYWHAETRGNGQGNSFVDIMGQKFIIED